MRYIRFLLTVLLLCLGMGARADNIVSLSSAQGEPGEEVSVSICMTNSDAVASLQVSIPFDENMTLVEGSGQLGSRCSGHSLSLGVNDGVLQVFVYSMSMAAITGNSGNRTTVYTGRYIKETNAAVFNVGRDQEAERGEG